MPKRRVSAAAESSDQHPPAKIKLRTVSVACLLLIVVYFVDRAILKSQPLPNSGTTAADGATVTTKSSTSSENGTSNRSSLPPDNAETANTDANTETTSPTNTTNSGPLYDPSPAEEYLIHNLPKLGMDGTGWTPTCHIWKDSSGAANAMPTPIFQKMQAFLPELQHHYQRLQAFLFQNVTDAHNVDIRLAPQGDGVCDEIDRALGGPDLAQTFNQSNLLSKTKNHGYVEPLLSPLRHFLFCQQPNYILNIDYIIHDFGHMCRYLQQTPAPRTVFVDMGASLVFHPGQTSPALQLMDLYRKFGIRFDHIYAFELTQQKPQKVYDAIPSHYKAAYHWYNVGVTSDKDSDQNPWNILLRNFSPYDLIIVKLDIDTPWLEHPLAHQLLDNPQLRALVNHFYFEYHHKQQELKSAWGRSGESATVKEAFELFYQLRQKGVAAHSWV